MAFFALAVTPDVERQIARLRILAGLDDAAQQRFDDRPDFRVDVRRPGAERCRMLVGNEAAVGVVVELGLIGADEERDRKACVQAGIEGVAKTDRPPFRRSECCARPVDRRNQFRKPVAPAVSPPSASPQPATFPVAPYRPRTPPSELSRRTTKWSRPHRYWFKKTCTYQLTLV